MGVAGTSRMAGMHPFCTAVAHFIPSDLQMFASHSLMPKWLKWTTSSSAGKAMASTILQQVSMGKGNQHAGTCTH